MVRNKNTSQSITVATSISKYGNSTKDIQTTEASSPPSSPTRQSSKKRLESLSPCKAKVVLPVMNGILEETMQKDILKLDEKSVKLMHGSSGELVHSSTNMATMNGFHQGDLLPKKESIKNMPTQTEPIFESGQKLKKEHAHTNRMHANSTNVYRKMFGRYKAGQEVLARWSDGLYYLGVICDVYDHGLQCEMKFEDESKFWVHFKDLHHINECAPETKDGKDKDDEQDDEESDVTCVICRDGVSDPPNEIVLCDKCGQGYHQECHMPNIDSIVLKDEEVPWQCRNCVFSACVRSGGAIKHGVGEMMKQMKRVLPYDINSLTWNKTHKINDEEKYCYCGGPGDWYLKMLQCARCTQWFHEACLQCLESPILYGDRFFLFVCSVCNNGNEFIKRLPMKWVDVVQLVLYNITIAKKVKYYDVDVMITFFNKHLESLRLNDMMKDIPTRSNLRQKVIDTLSNNKSRFHTGAEGKKTKSVWGLRNRSPPLPPSILLPAGIEINDDTFSSLDLKHGAGALSDSPTPLKKQGPCQSDNSPQSKQNMQITGRSPVKDLVKSGLFNLSGNDIAQDKLFENDVNMPPPKRRRPGRPKRSDALLPLPGSLKRTSSSSSLNSSKGWPGPPRKKKRRLSNASSGSGKTSETGSSISRLWGTNSSIMNDGASSCSSGSTEDSKSLRDAMARYFGAEDRVKCGERFRVLGKRVTTSQDGSERYEYLIEWEGYTARDLDAMKKY